jgi:hypothetical protein
VPTGVFPATRTAAALKTLGGLYRSLEPTVDALSAALANAGPIGLDHRYVAEDVVLGLSLLESAARTAGVESPATTGLLLVFSVLTGRVLSGRGRALEHLGLGDLLLREIRSLLVDGWVSPLWSRVVR